MKTILIAVALLTTALGAYAGLGTHQTEHVYRASTTVHFVYTHKPCGSTVLEEGLNGIQLVQGYAIDLKTGNRADGCVALYRHKATGQPIAEFMLRFKDANGVDVFLEHPFNQQLFNHRKFVSDAS